MGYNYYVISSGPHVCRANILLLNYIPVLWWCIWPSIFLINKNQGMAYLSLFIIFISERTIPGHWLLSLPEDQGSLYLPHPWYTKRQGKGKGRGEKGRGMGGKGRERKGRAEKPSLNPANSRLDSTRSFSLSLNASGLFSEASTLPFPGHRISINTDWNVPASVSWWQDSAGDSQESLVSSSHQASHCSITWLASVANLTGPGINWKPASEEDLGCFLVLTEWEFSPTGLDYSWMESWTV